jgi:hypothetical protein
MINTESSRERASRPDRATLDVNGAQVIAIDADGRIADLWDPPNDHYNTTESSTASRK